MVGMIISFMVGGVAGYVLHSAVVGSYVTMLETAVTKMAADLHLLKTPTPTPTPTTKPVGS